MLTSVYREILDDSISGDKIYGGTIDYVNGIITNELRIPKTVGMGDGYITGESFNIGYVDGGPFTPIGICAANLISARYLASSGVSGIYVYSDLVDEVFRARYVNTGSYSDMSLNDIGVSIFKISSLSTVQNFILDSITIGTNTDIATGYMLQVEGKTYLNGDTVINGDVEGIETLEVENMIFNYGVGTVSMQTLQAWLVETVEVHIDDVTGNPHNVKPSQIEDDSGVASGSLANTLNLLSNAITASVSASGIINDSTVAGDNVDDALNQLDSDITNLLASNIYNDALTAPGDDVDDALELLHGRVTVIEDSGVGTEFAALPKVATTFVYATALGTVVQFDAGDRSASNVILKVIGRILFLDINLSIASLGATVKYIGISVPEILYFIGGGYITLALGGGCSIEKTEASYNMYAGNIHVGGLSATVSGTQYIVMTRYDAENIGNGAFKFVFTGIGRLT